MLGGCGNNAQPAADSTKAEENSMDTSAQDEIVKDTADEAQQPSDDVQIPALEDGIYDAEFNTDSSMFHVNEANDGRGTLTVENGKMTIHVSLTSKHIVNLFVGTAEDARRMEPRFYSLLRIPLLTVTDLQRKCMDLMSR